jgi:prenylcysteine oxidase/farnesylcysteine lyase
MIWSLVLFPSLAVAFSWTSLFGGSVAADQYILQPANITNQLRVAIVGAGAAGSSAAFWISKAAERLGKDIAVDVYESSDYIGGSKLIIVSLHSNGTHIALRKYCGISI